MSTASFDIEVPVDLVYLQGHFPGQPVLPGVVQVHWAIERGTETFGDLGQFKGIDALKFHRIIEPNTDLQLQLEFAHGVLRFSYTSEHGQHSQGRILFE